MTEEAAVDTAHEKGPQSGKSDLAVRLSSAVVMLAVAGLALWLGGWVLDALIIMVGAAALVEWTGLVRKIGQSTAIRSLLVLLGIVYIAIAVWAGTEMPRTMFVLLLGIVVATDTGAYFSGRAIGGPKIAPSISPSKTWAGLIGGALVAGIVSAMLIWAYASSPDAPRAYANALETHPVILIVAFVLGALFACTAQAGDFLESWMKRRAGVKDSGALIPGHGGVLDRVDGFLPVMILGYALLIATAR